MKNNFFILFLTFLLSCTFLFFVKKQNTQLHDVVTDFSVLETPSPVLIRANILDGQALQSPVSREAGEQGYRVIVMTIENRTPYQYELQEDWVKLDHAKEKKILRHKRLSTLPRWIFYKIIGFFFWPIAIPGAIDSIVGMVKMHAFTDQLHASLLKKEGEILLPYSLMQRYLILDGENAPKQFSMHLLNCRTQQHENYSVEIIG
jgi:hypothetical protein